MHKLVVQHVWLSLDLRKPSLEFFRDQLANLHVYLIVHKITNLISQVEKFYHNFWPVSLTKCIEACIKMPFILLSFFVSWNEDSAWCSMLIGVGLGREDRSLFRKFAFLKCRGQWNGSEVLNQKAYISRWKIKTLGPDSELEGSLCLVYSKGISHEALVMALFHFDSLSWSFAERVQNISPTCEPSLAKI